MALENAVKPYFKHKENDNLDLLSDIHPNLMAYLDRNNEKQRKEKSNF